MTPLYYLQVTIHYLGEIAAAAAVIYWIEDQWTTNPAPPPVPLVRHPLRLWLAVALGVAAPLLGQALRFPLLALYKTPGLTVLQIPVSLVLSAVYGAMFGLAGSCSAAPTNAEKPFPWKHAGGISAALSLIAYLTYSLCWRQPWLRMAADMAINVGLLAGAYWLFHDASTTTTVPPLMAGIPPELPRPKGSAAPALILGFLPSAFIITGIGIASTAPLDNKTSIALLWAGSIASVICCFTASILLFTRKTSTAIAGGVVLLLLNGIIAFFLGCCATIGSSSFR
jgi:hypothetical protein